MPQLLGSDYRYMASATVGRDGSVPNVASAEGGLSNELTRCVTDLFQRMSFPPPDGGIVTVAYPLVFSPGS